MFNLGLKPKSGLFVSPQQSRTGRASNYWAWTAANSRLLCKQTANTTQAQGMGGSTTVNGCPEKDTRVEEHGRAEDEKLEEHGLDGVLTNGDEVEPPKIDMVFASQEHAREYYSKYGYQEGFGIMCRSSRCDDDGRLKFFVLSCSQSGKGQRDPNNKSQWRQTSKTNCKAKINAVLNGQGQFYLKNVILDHNHELTPGKLHRSILQKNRRFRAKKRRQGELAGIALQSGFQSFLGDSHGSENISRDSGLEGPSTSGQLANADKHIPCVYTSLPPTGETMSGRLKRNSSSNIPQNHQDSLRHALAKGAVVFVKSGMVIGLGTGGILSLVIEELGRLIKEGKLKGIVAVGANYQSRTVARQCGMTIADLNDVNDIDIAFDGVDEVDFNKNLLKCRGAGHTVQKVIDSMAKVCVILAEHTKVVYRLGCNIPVAVEVLPVAVSPVSRRLIALGGVPEIRTALKKDGSVITDLGNMIIDVSFPNGIQNPAELEKNINMIPGVVDNGIVSAVVTSVLVATKDGNCIKVMNLEEYIEVVIGWRGENSTL